MNTAKDLEEQMMDGWLYFVEDVSQIQAILTIAFPSNAWDNIISAESFYFRWSGGGGGGGGGGGVYPLLYLIIDHHTLGK